MIANLFRNLLASLSFFYKNNLELVKKKELTVNCSVSSHFVQDMGEELGLGAKSVPPERRRKSTRPIV